ncbi:MAG: hypothetical protein ACRYGP_02850 [Janthinobacterium lividum]
MTSLDGGSLHNRTSITDAIARLREPGHYGEGPVFSNPIQNGEKCDTEDHATTHSESARQVAVRDNRASELIGTIEVLDEGERMLRALGYPEHARVLAKIRIDIGEVRADRDCRG